MCYEMKISGLVVSSSSNENQSQKCFTSRSHIAVQEFWNRMKLLVKKNKNKKKNSNAKTLTFPLSCKQKNPDCLCSVL